MHANLATIRHRGNFDMSTLVEAISQLQATEPVGSDLQQLETVNRSSFRDA
jgi:hypothetical protein